MLQIFRCCLPYNFKMGKLISRRWPCWLLYIWHGDSWTLWALNWFGRAAHEQSAAPVLFWLRASSHCQVWFLITSLKKSPVTRFGRTADSRKSHNRSSIPNIHVTIIVAIVLLGTLRVLEMILYPCTDWCLTTILLQRGTDSSLYFIVWLLYWHAVGVVLLNHPSIHSLSTAYPGLGCGGSSFKRVV